MHEMNGNWYPWCGTVNGNTPEDFAAAWHHIRNIVTTEVASEIKWVWSPYAKSFPMEPINGIESYFPGDAFIDWVAIDGYNWGTSMNWSTWQGFEEIFSDAYEKAITMSRRPVMIAEVASSEAGGSKEQWTTDAFRILKKRFQKVEILVWFDINKEYHRRFWQAANFAALQDLEKIANDAGKSMTELAFQWLASQDHVDSIIIGATKVEHLEQNIAAAGGRLDDTTLEACDAVWQRIRGGHFKYNR